MIVFSFSNTIFCQALYYSFSIHLLHFDDSIIYIDLFEMHMNVFKCRYTIFKCIHMYGRRNLEGTKRVFVDNFDGICTELIARKCLK